MCYKIHSTNKPGKCKGLRKILAGSAYLLNHLIITDSLESLSIAARKRFTGIVFISARCIIDKLLVYKIIVAGSILFF